MKKITEKELEILKKEKVSYEKNIRYKWRTGKEVGEKYDFNHIFFREGNIVKLEYNHYIWNNGYKVIEKTEEYEVI